MCPPKDAISAQTISVLVVTNAFPTDSTPGNPSIKEQLLALQRRGVHIDLLIIETSNKKAYIKTAWRLFLLTFQKRRYNIVHTYYGLCGLLALLQFKYPIIVTFLGSDLLNSKNGHYVPSRDCVIGRIVARLVDGVIVMTEEMRQVTKREDAIVIPFGIDLNIFSPCPKNQARLELEIPFNEKLILFPWKPTRTEKRFDVVEGAFHLLQGQFEKVRLITLYNKPHEMVAKYMNACDVMVLASEHEGSPVTVKEAIACNLPIVSVDVGDVAEIINEIDGCYLCERTPKDMAEKIGWVLMRGHRVDGHQRIKNMTVDWAVEKVLDLYKQISSKIKQKN